LDVRQVSEPLRLHRPVIDSHVVDQTLPERAGGERASCTNVQTTIVTRQASLSVPGNLYIGAGSTLTPGSFWKGLIDDIRIYNRVAKP